jgi:hypothetical protein
MAVSGTITTAYLAAKASFKAADVIEKDRARRKEEHLPISKDLVSDSEFDLNVKDKAKLIWPHYIPATVTGAATITCIIMSNQLASKRIAALATAAGISERAFQEYKSKVVEKIGEHKERAVRDEVAQERVANHPMNTREIILAGTGEVLCFDLYTGRYFQSSVEEIKKAVNTVNSDIIQHMYASLTRFYEEIGLPRTELSDSVGWNADQLIELDITTVLSNDNRPCIAIGFTVAPNPEYTRLY